MRHLIDKCRNMHGPLSEDLNARLQAVIDNPTIETWEDAHSIIIQTEPKEMTLWQAWIAIDSDAPDVGRRTDFRGNVIREWERIPSSFTLLRALQFATE
jgi:hypothetical protein